MVFRCLIITAIKNIPIIKGMTNNNGNSGTDGVGLKVGVGDWVGEALLFGIVIVCMGLQSLELKSNHELPYRHPPNNTQLMLELESLPDHQQEYQAKVERVQEEHYNCW